MDTNVLYAGLYSSNGASHRVLRMIETGRVVPMLSTSLLYEYEEILKRHHQTLGLNTKNIEDVLNGLCEQGEAVIIHFLWRPQLRDPKDDHVLELAIAANHVPIITHNKRDFMAASKFDIRVVSPAEFLKEIR